MHTPSISIPPGDHRQKVNCRFRSNWDVIVGKSRPYYSFDLFYFFAPFLLVLYYICPMDFARNSNPRWFWFVKLFVIAFDRGTTHKFACKLRMNVQQSTKEFRLKSLKRMSVDECTPMELRIYITVLITENPLCSVYCSVQHRASGQTNKTHKKQRPIRLCVKENKIGDFFL